MQLFPEPILAIESSCDETSAAVIVGRSILSNVVATQIEMHQKWGGVVPEAAARAHIEAILPVITQALETAEITLQEIKAIAVTNRPGLVGALSVGVTAAKALSARLKIPLIGVHHIEGHLLSILALSEDPIFPMVTLVVSGGHSELVLVSELGHYTILGETRDDAAGEAFDKGARLLGLGYPGGRQIQEQALTGNPRRYPLPKALGTDTYEMSFSGLKTAMLRLVEKEGNAIHVPDAAASLQAAVVGVLTDRMKRAIERENPATIAVVGGVAANTSLRQAVTALATRYSIRCLIPPIDVCTDNAGMIGLAGSVRLALGERSGLDLESLPGADLP